MAVAPSIQPDLTRADRGWAIPFKIQILIVFCVAALIVFLCAPWPLSILEDDDQCFDLVGAQMIALGEHPFISFGTDYGPLVFYTSYLAQHFGGHSLAAEFLTDTVGYALAYTLIFINASLMTRRKLIPPLVTLLALIQLPRFYKYYILLGPSASLLALLLYLARPTRMRLLFVALCAVVTGLFRPDMGAYAVIGALVAIRISAKSWREFAAQASQLMLMLLAVCSPWLIFLASHHGLYAYFRDSIIVAASHAEGLSNPVPRLNLHQRIFSANNLAAMSYVIWWSTPVLGIAMLAARWKQLGDLLRHRAIICSCLALLCLAQSGHRSGYAHLIQAIAASYVVIAFAMDQFLDLSGPGMRLFKPAIVVLAFGIAGISIAAGVSSFAIRGPSTKSFPNYARYYFCDRREFVRRLMAKAQANPKAPINPNLQLIQFVDANIKPDDRVFLVSYLTNVYYFADRKAAGGQICVAPGFFSADSDQQAIIATLKVQHNPMVIECLVGYDGLESRAFRSFEPKVFEYLKSAYQMSVDPGLPPGYVVWRVRS